jgi:hypothetical protein
MLKLKETLTRTIYLQEKGEKIRSVPRKEARETPRTSAVEETSQ